MKQTKWLDIKFNFDTVQNTFPSIIERLTGTPVRLEEKLKLIPPSHLEEKINGTWSIKENIGHLTDLETLWQGRILDFKNGELELRPADLENTKTHRANHNDKPISELIDALREARQKTIKMLEDSDEELIFKTALHPRLKKPMRLMDSFLFTAEHDDYHLARISEILKTIKNT